MEAVSKPLMHSFEKREDLAIFLLTKGWQLLATAAIVSGSFPSLFGLVSFAEHLGIVYFAIVLFPLSNVMAFG
jgi:hypothetical protein